MGAFFSRGVFVKDLSEVGVRVDRAGKVEDKESKDVQFDVIIVGGGTAGCVLAARLTEDPSIHVLLLEAGGSARGLIFSRVPAGYSKLFRTKHVFQLYTEPQHGTPKFWPRAKLLGGCSSINAQMAQYGAPEDFDEWAVTCQDDSWAWKNFGRYFKKFEQYTHHAKYPDLDISTKGDKGPVRVGYFSTISEASDLFIKSCTQVGIPFSPDFNGPTGTRGVNRVMTYVDQNSKRVSSETAYLTPDVLARPNLKVATHTQVSRIIFEKTSQETRAVGVEFTRSENGPLYRAYARREVVLSAGAIHSPHLLLLSGVGPEKQLKEHDIPLIRDLPVGQSLVDHPVVDVNFKDKLNDSPHHIVPRTPWHVVMYLFSILKYLLVKRGPLASNFGEAAAFIRTDDTALFPPTEYPATLKDSTSSRNSPDIELFSTPFAFKKHGAEFFGVHTVGLHVCLLRPLSRGTLRLKSSSVWDDPEINPNYLDAPDDLARLVRGLRLICKIAATEPLSRRLDLNDKNPALDTQLHLKSDKELEEFVRTRVETLYHPASTCRMAPLADGGVVDSTLRVHGLEGLRVCDASIFPSIVSGHTAAAVFATAEKFSDMLKAELAASA